MKTKSISNAASALSPSIVSHNINTGVTDLTERITTETSDFSAALNSRSKNTTQLETTKTIKPEYSMQHINSKTAAQ